MVNMPLQSWEMAVVDQGRLPTRLDLVMRLTGDGGSCRWISMEFRLDIGILGAAHLSV